MISPSLYAIRKFKLRDIVESNYNLYIQPQEEKKYYINQQDNMLLRQIRLITNNNKKYNPYVIFINCVGCKTWEKELDYVCRNGIYINGIHFTLCERSPSMSRNGILSFVDSVYINKLNKIIDMDAKPKKTIIPKYQACRGLMFSGCFCLENWYPKIIVVDDYEKIISNQYIKYAINKKSEYIDKNTGEIKSWIEKDIIEGYKDINIIPFDGAGIIHPSIVQEIKEKLGITTNANSFMLRAPYIKGIVHSLDYIDFLTNKGISEIVDIWGIKHDVYEPMIILTKSMYKGYKYFQNTKTILDWIFYWEAFKKYNHCIGIAKWNFDMIEEPLYDRLNYQILQDLVLDYDEFISLAEDSLDWASKVVNGNELYTYCFLGLFVDKYKPRNNYMKSILKNPHMLKDPCVRGYINKIIKKIINDMKCGKLWIKGTFRILTPDLIALMEYIGGLEVKGCLNSGEFYSKGIEGVCEGEWLIERNPHISNEEHVILNGGNNNLINQYCGHLEGITMINCHDVIDARLNGSDKDGDLVFTINSDIIKKGVVRNTPFVIDIEDKIATVEEEYNLNNIIKTIKLTMDNRIGEYSNCASGYHNKCPKTLEQKERYLKNINLIAILNAKEIDYAKCGVRFNLPRLIAKYSKPLPYFMKYAGKYYSKCNKLSHAPSNMNRLCKQLEKWHKTLRFKNTFKDFDYNIMINPELYWDNEIFIKIENVFLEYNKEMQELKKQDSIYKNKYNDDNYSNYFGDLNKQEIIDSEINYNYYYDKYREKLFSICSDIQILANYLIKLCYEKYPNKSKHFAWFMAGDGIVKNIKQIKIKLPMESEDGKFEYLGKYYNLVEADIFVE